MSFMKWIDKGVNRDKKRIDKAFGNKKVGEFLKQKKLGLDDLKEADRRIQMLGIRESAKKKALRDIEDLSRLFSESGPCGKSKSHGWSEMDVWLTWACFVIEKYK